MSEDTREGCRHGGSGEMRRLLLRWVFYGRVARKCERMIRGERKVRFSAVERVWIEWESQRKAHA